MADKGTYLGPCNRTACQAPGADCWNESTRKWYCLACAKLINREAEKVGEPPLCRLASTPCRCNARTETECRKDCAMEGFG